MGYLTIFFKFVLAIALGGIIGWEREAVHKPAGLRTYILICLGATLITVISTTFTMPGADPGRIAAQIVSGLGLLGGLVVLREGPTLKGITTAVGLWLMGGVGIAIGAGKYFPAAMATIMAYIVLVSLKSLEGKFFGEEKGRTLTVKAKNRSGLIGDIGSILGSYGVDIKDISLELEDNTAQMIFKVTVPKTLDSSAMLPKIQNLADIQQVKWE